MRKKGTPTPDEIFQTQITRESLLTNKDGSLVYKSAGDSPSFVANMAYQLTKHLTIDDWRVIRKGDYYDIRDKLKGVKRDKFIINRVHNYLKTRQ